MNAIIPGIAAIQLCLSFSDMRQLAGQARGWAATAPGGPLTQAAEPLGGALMNARRKMGSVFSAVTKERGHQSQSKDVSLGRARQPESAGIQCCILELNQKVLS